MTGVWVHLNWNRVCVLFKPPPQLFLPATTPTTQTSLCLGKFLSVRLTSSRPASCGGGSKLNHTRFWQAVMEILEGASDKAAPSLRLPDYTVRAASAADAGWRSLCGSSRRFSDSKPAQTLQSLFWKVLFSVVHVFSTSSISTVKLAVFCSFSMPSLLPASTTPALAPAADWRMPLWSAASSPHRSLCSGFQAVLWWRGNALYSCLWGPLFHPDWSKLLWSDQKVPNMLFWSMFL